MTIIACWLNQESKEPSIWVVSDTRISKERKTVLLDSAPKIFSLLVQCKCPDALGFYNQLYYSKEVGMAYAGSSLVGLNSYITLNSLLKNLIHPDGQTIPSMRDIANYAAKILRLIIAEVGIIETSRASCEIAIFGFCDCLCEFKIFHLHPTRNPEIDIEVIESNILDNDYILLLGNHKDEILDLIHRGREENTNNKSRWWRMPQEVIRKVIIDNKLEGIGGGVNLGILTRREFKLYIPLPPIESGSYIANFTYQNIDISQELGQVGKCSIGLPMII